MGSALAILVIVVVLALAFDYINGFHDTANAIATSVSTRAMSPRFAVAMSAVLNFAGAFISLKVAATVGSGIVDSGAVTTTTTVPARLAAGCAESSFPPRWNSITSRRPSASWFWSSVLPC